MRGMEEQGLASVFGTLHDGSTGTHQNSCARSIITTIGDASSAESQKRTRTASVVPTSVITNLKLLSLTVAALQAHDKPPDPMQTSAPYFPAMSTTSLSPWSSGATERSGCAGSGSGSLLPHQQASYWEQKLDPFEHMLARGDGRVRNQANLLLETHDGTPDPVLKEALSGL